MITKKDIVQMVRKISKQKTGGVDHQLMHPERDWLIGLGIATVFFIAGMFYTGYTFLGHLERSEYTASVDSSVVQYDQAMVSEVLERYEMLEQAFETLRNERTAPVTQPEQDAQEENVEEGADVPEEAGPGTPVAE